MYDTGVTVSQVRNCEDGSSTFGVCSALDESSNGYDDVQDMSSG